MTDERLRMALIFGGRSAEHEVSVRSARSVFEAMDRERYNVVPVMITPAGAWYRRPADSSSFQVDPVLDETDRLIFSPDPAHHGFLAAGEGGGMEPFPVDVAFPCLHGTYGEDGTIQGLFEMADIPYVGCGVLASSAGMDKVVMKRLFAANGLEVGPFTWFLRSEWRRDRDGILAGMADRTFPLFVKPANLGSSVGISRVKSHDGLAAAIDKAASYDRKIVVEDEITGRELEVSVLGNEQPSASVPGEILSHAEFYDYEEKYHTDTAELIIPADVTEDERRMAAETAVKAFQAVDGSGLGRVDMFLTPDGRMVVNEINTLPGFTSISMYPKLWEATGIPYAELIDRLIDLALERHRDKQSNVTDRPGI